MRIDVRLARMLHVLVHMHGREGTTSSEELAVMLNTNPVLVRRMMAGLREAGHVRSTPGRNGGWVLAVDPDAITVLDVYQALEEPVIFAMSPSSDHPGCAAERAIGSALDVALAQAAGALLREFGAIRLSAFVARAGREEARTEGGAG